jgi:hypothetical protein
MEQSLVIARGERARRAGRPITANPYEQDTPAWHAWRKGWERRPGRAAPAPSSRRESATD